jgi:hypothetical protein
VADEDEYFGADRSIAVTPMKMNRSIRTLHIELANILKNAGAEFDEPQYMFEGYKAHATVQENARLSKGDTVEIDSITIIDKLPSGNPHKRKLLKTISFR